MDDAQTLRLYQHLNLRTQAFAVPTKQIGGCYLIDGKPIADAGMGHPEQIQQQRRSGVVAEGEYFVAVS
jgi:hypothetical protein